MAARFTSTRITEAKARLDRILARPDRKDSSTDSEGDHVNPADDADSPFEENSDSDLENSEDQGSDSEYGGTTDVESGEDEGSDSEYGGTTDYNDDDDDDAAGVRVHPDTFLSKDGRIEWSSVPLEGRASNAHPPRSDPTAGPTPEATAGALSIMSSFLLFFTAEIEKVVLLETNREGSRGVSANWKPMDETDLRVYVGLLILAGVYRSRGEAAASLWDAECGRAIFRATMSLKDFYSRSKALRFDDREARRARAADKLAAIRDVWDMWCVRLPALYNPGPDVTVDERMVPFKGRCSFRQYMPNKPAKYGLKLWVACDAKTSYAWRMQAYTGRPGGDSDTRERNLASRVVMDVTVGLKNRTVTCDNFFTSYALARTLSLNGVSVLGTVRRNKPELPPELLSVRGREVFSTKFAFSELATLASYVPKRNKTVLLLSTKHPTPEIDGRRKDRKPQMILDYNRTKGGVDNLDKMLAAYSCRRMTERWPAALFHNILDVSAYNAYVIWRETHPGWMPGKRNRRRVFLERLGRDLVAPLIVRRRRAPRAESAHALMTAIRSTHPEPPDSLTPDKRKRCQFCPRERDAKTRVLCKGCGKYICGTCTVPFCRRCATMGED